jgi:hypothetical protein
MARGSHGLSATRGYNVWSNMMKRCFDQRNVAYRRYGGRGITVCERWRDVRNFIADMGQPSEKLTLDRINNDGHYELGNCRWATRSEQRRNCSRPLRMLDFGGRSQCLQDWADELAIPYKRLAARLDICGWSVEKALSAQPFVRDPTRRTSRNRFLAFNGKRQTVKEWSVELGLSRTLIARRIDHFGWTLERALSSPLGFRGPNRPKAGGVSP